MNALARFNCGVLAVSLLIAGVVCAPICDAAPKDKPPKTTENSDLNQDGVVDYNDLVIFSTDYLGQPVETVDWCAFYTGTGQEDELYGRPPDYYTKHFGQLLEYINVTYSCDLGELSDLNGDGRINTRDLMAFSEEFAGEHFMLVDWCAFLQGVLDGSTQYGRLDEFYLEHYGSLLLYIEDRYRCFDAPPPPPPPGDPLVLKNSPKFLTRIAVSRNATGDYYVTDAKAGSVFIYDSNLGLSRELKNLAKPLGIAVNGAGHILVGNDKRKNVEVYDPDNGTLLASFGETELETPTSIMLDSEENVYVTDTGSNTIYIYDNTYMLITNIGEPGKDPHQLRSPSHAILSVDESELFVLDRLNNRIQVYDLAGNWSRSITFAGTEGENCSWFTGVCEIPGAPPFSRLQAMDFDAEGKLHVLDIFHAVVFIMDPQTGAYISSYGSFGPEDGQLKSPTSLIMDGGQVLVTDGGKNTIEVLAIP
jgi:WD40 repeat protein